MRLLVLDSETTGVDPDKDRVVEIAGAIVDTTKKKITKVFEQLVNPGIPIPPEAMAIHHILDRQVADAPTLEEAIALHVTPLMDFVPVAHNAEFDSKFIPLPGMRWVCTWRCAKHLFPDVMSYSNQALRYALRLFKEPEAKAMPPHRARADVWVTANLLLRMLDGRTERDLLSLTEQPILLRTVHFGKHRGEKWADVPRDYLRWILKSDFDRDVEHTARHYLNGKG